MRKDKDIYVQCKFIYGKKEDVGWIPERLARIGKTIVFKSHPEEQWTVVETWSKREYSYLKERERDFLGQREFSDI